MGIQELFNWYQKKIGTYDKQLWEKTLEQRIIQGLTHIQTKSAKPKTDLIDLDLVRGSSFTKAKPKHGFITVARLATLRLLFMPLYAKWWVQQTSGKTFFFFLLLYLSEFVNIALYWCNVSKMTAEAQTVPFSEITVPIIMMWVLSFVHSEIVATKSESEHSRPKVKSQRPYRRRRSRGKKVSIGKTLSDDTDVDPNIVKKTHHRRKINWEFDLATEKSDLEAAEPIKKDAEPQPVAGSSRHTKRDNDVSRDAPVTPKQPVDDDGFESLNGNGSSPSDNGEPVAAPDKTSQKPLLEESYNLKEECDIRDKEKEHLCNKENFEKCESWVRSLANTGNAKLQRQLSAPNLLQDSSDCESDGSTGDGKRKQKLIARRNSQIPSLSLNSAILDSTCDTDDEAFSSPETGITYPLSTEVANSTSEWLGVTTNSEDCSYSSEYNESDSPMDSACDHLTYDFDLTPTAILSPCCAPSDRVSCTIWEHSEIKKADLSVFDISSVIISKVESTPDSMDYFYIGLSISTVLAVLPALFRFFSNTMENLPLEIANPINDVPDLIFKQPGKSLLVLIDAALGKTVWERTVMVIAALQRWILATIFFFLLAVAEKTFKQRFLYAKLFSHLTSSRRARKSDLPHFRLNKVRNIKTWLSVRSYLKKRGLQRSVDVIVSAAFIISLLLLSFLSMELLKDTVGLHSQYNIEAMIWSIGLGILLLRFMTLGTKINRKYRNLSVLITEQINLYLQIEQKPEKKNELMVANSVLKLAADLLKELESPFKISGLSANPYLYNITKVVILSALSGVLSDMLGFKLKLHKIKVK